MQDQNSENPPKAKRPVRSDPPLRKKTPFPNTAKTTQIAAQLYTCRHLLKTPADIAKTLHRIREIGYTAVQISGMGPTPEEELNTILDGEGLVCCATHEASDGILNNPEKVVERLQKLRCKYAAYPYPANVGLGSKALVDEMISKLGAARAVLAAAGQVLCAGKDYFTDKTPFTTLAQLEEAKAAVAETGRKYMVYFSERLHVECAVHAGTLIKEGLIGRVVQTLGTGPHRLSASTRPGWFFDHAQYGGILCDIGSHQCEQFLIYTGARDATIVASTVGNFANPDHPELEDFGECNLSADNGASGYFRIDWLTPNGLSTWGNGRMVILGTTGYMELRKYTDVATGNGGDQLILVDGDGEKRIPCAGKVGYPFFGQLILDSLNRTETAMTQNHAFKAAELCLLAQQKARRLTATLGEG